MKKKHLGSNFDDFLEQNGILEECRATAIKFKIALELEKAMDKQRISKAEMAKRLRTSRTGIDRLLDPQNTSITLNTMAKVAQLLGERSDRLLPARTRPVTPTNLFIITRAVSGIMRAASQEESPLLGTPEFEDELVHLVQAYFAGNS